MENPEEDRFVILGFRRLVSAPPWIHALVCSCGVFVSFILHDFLQELIVKMTKGRIPLGMTCFEFAACAGLPGLQLALSRRGCFETGKTAPSWPFWAIAGFLLASLALGNVALRWVSYPVKVVLKSSKLLPAMGMGVLLLGKRYTWPQYLAALCLTVGVVGASYADRYVEGDKESSLLGVGLLLVAVCCDAISPVMQERMLGKYAISAPELMLRTNLIALVGILFAWVAAREAEMYVDLPAHNPLLLLLALCVYGTSSWLGVTFMLALIEGHGSAMGVAVGTLRKVITIVLSFLWWRKPFSSSFALSGLAVLLSIALNAKAKAVSDAVLGMRRRAGAVDEAERAIE